VYFALVIIFVLIETVFHFKLKRDKVPDFDRSLSRLKHVTVFFAALLGVAGIFLPHSYYRDINPEAENALRDLVLNQQRMAADLHQLREVLFVIITVSMLYAIGAATLIGTIYQERRRKEMLADPRLKKPLGLEN